MAFKRLWFELILPSYTTVLKAAMQVMSETSRELEWQASLRLHKKLSIVQLRLISLPTVYKMKTSSLILCAYFAIAAFASAEFLWVVWVRDDGKDSQIIPDLRH